MISKGFRRKYVVSRAVEEPLDASFELGEDLQDISGTLTRPILLGIIGFIILILLLLPNLYDLFSFIYNGFIGSLELTTELLIRSFGLSIILIIIVAISATSLVYLVQIHKFNTYLLQRYSIVTSLKSAEFREETGTRKEAKPGRPRIDPKLEGRGKHLKNPIFAMIDLVEESMHELPQIVKLLRFCTFFIISIVIFLSLLLLIDLAIGQNLLFRVGPWEQLFGVITIILFIPTLKLLMDSENLFRYLRTRHDIIDSVRFEKDIRIPAGKDQLTRLIQYVTEHDPYIKSSTLANSEKFSRDLKIKGRSGQAHRFDAYFSGLNVLKAQSVSLGMPMGNFAVFIKVFKNNITLKKLRNLRETVEDVCEQENLFPLRVIALQLQVEELEDEVYDYVFENPIRMKNTLTHLQIVAEDGDVYSFIPIISYGKEAGPYG